MSKRPCNKCKSKNQDGGDCRCCEDCNCGECCNSCRCCDGRREEITLSSSVDSPSKSSSILATKIVMGAVHQRWAVTFKSVDKVQTFAYAA